MYIVYWIDHQDRDNETVCDGYQTLIALLHVFELAGQEYFVSQRTGPLTPQSMGLNPLHFDNWES